MNCRALMQGLRWIAPDGRDVAAQSFARTATSGPIMLMRGCNQTGTRGWRVDSAGHGGRERVVEIRSISTSMTRTFVASRAKRGRCPYSGHNLARAFVFDR